MANGNAIARRNSRANLPICICFVRNHRYSEKWTTWPSSASSPRSSWGPCLERGTPQSSSSSSDSPRLCSGLEYFLSFLSSILQDDSCSQQLKHRQILLLKKCVLGI
ncbi:unnamed protein product [Ectocarpus fasciculatus]